jgi:hypothetical protein
LRSDRSKGNEPDNDTFNRRFPPSRQPTHSVRDHSDLAVRRRCHARGPLLAALRQLEKAHSRQQLATVSAIIDVVSVAFIKDDIPSPKANLDDSYYKATLTYTFNNPEQQMGDYSRDFANEADAKAWANSYKGETVKVHVDPRDPTRSLLRKEDL